MKETFWSYLLIMLGLFIIVVMMLVQDLTSTSEEDYYLTKEVMQAAMIDSIDYGVYREYGDIRIITEKFVENFTRRFSESVNSSKTYTLEFYEIYESPPKATVRIKTATREYAVSTDTAVDFDIVTILSGILESKDIETQSNYETINIVVQNGSVSSGERYVVPGVDTSIYVTPNYGYSVDGATFTCSDGSKITISSSKKSCASGEVVYVKDNTVTISNPVARKTYNILLRKYSHSISLYVENGGLTTARTVSMDAGGSAEFTFVSNEGYTVEGATMTCVGKPTYTIKGNKVTISNSTVSNEICTIYLKPVVYNVTFEVTNGSVSGSNYLQVLHNGSVSAAVIPRQGYTAEDMTVSCTGTSNISVKDNIVTVNNVKSSQTCRVTLNAITSGSYLSYETSSTGKYDIKIIDADGGNSALKTTYNWGGYDTYFKVNDKSEIQYNADINGGVITYDNVTLSLSAANVGNGVLAVNYTIKNNGTNRATYAVASTADIYIVDNDHAIIYKYDYTSLVTSSSGYKITLDFETPVSTSWMGRYSARHTNKFKNSSITQTTGQDSGLAFSWSGTIEPGETIIKTVKYIVSET